MQVLADFHDHRHMVNAVLPAAIDCHLLVEGAPPWKTWTLARTGPGIDTLRGAGVGNNRDAMNLWRGAGFPDNAEIKPKGAPCVEAMVILEKPLYAKR